MIESFKLRNNKAEIGYTTHESKSDFIKLSEESKLNFLMLKDRNQQ